MEQWIPKLNIFVLADVPMEIRCAALECVDHLSEHLDFSEYASRIIHPLVRCLDTTPELRTPAMDTLSALVIQLGKKYTIFIPMVHKVLIKQKINNQRYEILSARVLEGGTAADFEDSMLRFPRKRRQEKPEPPAMQATDLNASIKKLPVPTDDLSKAWQVSRRVSKDDWLEWYSGLCRYFNLIHTHPPVDIS